MINVEDITKEETKEHNPNCPKLPDHPYRIFAIGGSLWISKNKFII